MLSYARARGWRIEKNNVFLEGTTDQAVFRLARRKEMANTGVDLFADGISFIAAGEGDQGGTTGVLRELTTMRSLSNCVLDQHGRPRYRFVGLVDDDRAGRRSVKNARSTDPTIREYRDLFRVRPVMPIAGNLDVRTLEKSYERLNVDYAGIEWELEDLVSSRLFNEFCGTNPSAVRQQVRAKDRVHRELGPDGKRRFHTYVKQNATCEDLHDVLTVIRAMRFVLKLPSR